MSNFKKLTEEELAALNPTEQVKYQANLQAYEAEQAKEEAEAKAKDEVKEKAEPKTAKAEPKIAKAEPKTTKAEKDNEASEGAVNTEYLTKKEIEELKANNPTLKEFFVTSDKTAFPNRWLAENHNRNCGSDEVIQHIKK